MYIYTIVDTLNSQTNQLEKTTFPLTRGSYNSLKLARKAATQYLQNLTNAEALDNIIDSNTKKKYIYKEEIYIDDKSNQPVYSKFVYSGLDIEKTKLNGKIIYSTEDQEKLQERYHILFNPNNLNIILSTRS